MFLPKSSQEVVAFKALQALGFIRPGWFLSFGEFTNLLNPELQRLTQFFSVPDFTSTVQLLYALWVVHNAGAAVFRLKPGLIKLLQETDLPRDMSMELLRLPFEGINLDIPPKTLRPPLDSVTRLFLTQVPGDRFRIVCCTANGYTHYVSLRPNSGTIEDAVIETKTRTFESVSKEVEEEMRATWIYEDYFTSDLFVFPVNAALYITSEGADVVEDKTAIHELCQKLQGLKKSAKRERLEAKLAEEKQHKIYICGGKLSVQRELTATFTEEGRKLTKRFRVRGHWRNQPCGPRWSERKHIFVAPHWKGPTFAELLERNYIVKE